MYMCVRVLAFRVYVLLAGPIGSGLVFFSARSFRLSRVMAPPTIQFERSRLVVFFSLSSRVFFFPFPFRSWLFSSHTRAMLMLPARLFEAREQRRERIESVCGPTEHGSAQCY